MMVVKLYCNLYLAGNKAIMERLEGSQKFHKLFIIDFSKSQI